MIEDCDSCFWDHNGVLCTNPTCEDEEDGPIARWLASMEYVATVGGPGYRRDCGGCPGWKAKELEPLTREDR